MATPPSSFDCYAIVAPGLEALAQAEARSLGIPSEIEEGGLAWRGDARSVLLANATLRIASRVLVRLDSFEARSFAELERHARKIAWSRIVKPGDAVRFRVTCKKSKLYHSDAVAQRLSDAVMRMVPGVHAEGGSVADEDTDASDPVVLFVVRLMRDRCTVSADSSGELLHRRGYRQATAKAPLRETLGAALLASSGWNDGAIIMDPLCGSGTIPIEAALRARGMAPGLGRRFAMERWPSVSPTLGDRVRAELTQRVRPSTATIIGSDRDAGAVESAIANAERAGVAQDVRFLARSLSAIEFPHASPGGGLGWVVSNPPYGVRVGDADRVRDLWAQLGNVLRERARGWMVALLSPDPALDRQLRLPMRTVATTSNGGIPVRIIVGEVP